MEVNCTVLICTGTVLRSTRNKILCYGVSLKVELVLTISHDKQIKNVKKKRYGKVSVAQLLEK